MATLGEYRLYQRKLRHWGSNLGCFKFSRVVCSWVLTAKPREIVAVTRPFNSPGSLNTYN